jgi:membrane protease YdiL (CAAX protease family)
MRPAHRAWDAAALPRPATAGALAVLGVVAVGIASVQAGAAPAARVLMLLLVAPVLEEVVFRAGVQDALERHLRAPGLANVLTALAFGIAHAVWRADAAALLVALPALLVGAVYARGHCLAPCVLLHAAMNAAWLGWQLS